MIRRLRKSLILFLVFLIPLANFSGVQASRGLPSSAEFGFGAVLYPNGPFLKEALASAVELELDWIYIPVAWDAYQPAAIDAPLFEQLAPVMALAEERQILVVVSISQAPVWAQTPQGPEPARVMQFVRALIERYPNSIKAVELFPGANTVQGWGSPPSPRAYITMFRQIDDLLREMNVPILLVAGGLQPLTSRSASKDMDDLAFLSSLYQFGASGLMPVISLQFTDLNGDPLTFPGEATHPVLRHYEDVRTVMVKNQHRNGLIWITQLNLPSGKITVQDSTESNLRAQAVWLSQVYIQLRAQLYIGAAFLQSLNPEPEGAAAQVPSLLYSATDFHPFYMVLREMIGLNKTGSVILKPGKPKEGNLEKKRP
jgi:hypothetical protein